MRYLLDLLLVSSSNGKRTNRYYQMFHSEGGSVVQAYMFETYLHEHVSMTFIKREKSEKNKSQKKKNSNFR